MTMLTRLFHHHHWANMRLIDALANLPAGALAEELPGGYGIIEETLAHYILNEGIFLQVLDGGISERAEPPAEEPTLDDLRAVAVVNHKRLLAFAIEVEEGTRSVGSRDGRDYDFPAYVPLFQAYHHGVEHRTNITMTLAAHGYEVPNLDWWTYFAAGSPE